MAARDRRQHRASIANDHAGYLGQTSSAALWANDCALVTPYSLMVCNAMPTTIEQIDQWRAAPAETEHLEFKEAKNSYDIDSLCEYAVALSNEGGGNLLLGIHNTPPREVVGSQAFRVLGDVAQRVHQKLGFRVDFEEVAHPSGRVVVVTVPGRPRGVPRHRAVGT